MKLVILRDDDCNATTPPELLERLYRPFLDRGLEVNLATIPEVCTSIYLPDGTKEGFLFGRLPANEQRIAIERNTELVSYILDEPNYRVIQHGLSHELIRGRYEFDIDDANEICTRLDRGLTILQEAGFARPTTFVAPQDRLSRRALREVLQRYSVLSSGWYELRRLPVYCWPRYLAKRHLKQDHWRVGKTNLLTHPGCLLSRFRQRKGMLETIKATIQSKRLTVLVNHWWEFFPDGIPDQGLIDILHQVAEYLASTPGIRVISFDSLARDEGLFAGPSQ